MNKKAVSTWKASSWPRSHLTLVIVQCELAYKSEWRAAFSSCPVLAGDYRGLQRRTIFGRAVYEVCLRSRNDSCLFTSAENDATVFTVN